MHLVLDYILSKANLAAHFTFLGLTPLFARHRCTVKLYFKHVLSHVSVMHVH